MKFVRKNLAQIVIISGVFVFFQLIKSFPYINIIPNYQVLVVGFVLLLAIILFKIFVSNRNIILFVMFLFGLATITTILEMEIVSDLIGFAIFVLLGVSLRQVVRDRKEFKKETDFS